MPGPGTWAAGDILTAADLNAIGTWNTYTPTLAQNGTRTATVNEAKYCLINKLCFAIIDLTCTTSGSATNRITVSLPVSVATASTSVMGSGFFYDLSATNIYIVSAVYQTSTTIKMVDDGSGSASGFGQSPDITLANGDVISLQLCYLAA